MAASGAGANQRRTQRGGLSGSPIHHRVGLIVEVVGSSGGTGGRRLGLRSPSGVRTWEPGPALSISPKRRIDHAPWREVRLY